MTNPILIVLAGPNGAGKTTFFERNLASTGVLFVNADLLARELSPDDVSGLGYAAAELAESERRHRMARRETFCMETVFSDPKGEKLQLLRDAQAMGYEIRLVFIGLDSPELSSARVAQRVQDSGHDVPDEKLLARFPRVLQNLRQALTFVSSATLYDNSSSSEPFRLVAQLELGRVTYKSESVPGWAKEALGP